MRFLATRNRSQDGMNYFDEDAELAPEPPFEFGATEAALLEPLGTNMLASMVLASFAEPAAFSGWPEPKPSC